MNNPLKLEPFFLYGTAWKEEESARLTFEALQSGFRGIDTANQRKHYHEVGVGEGIQRYLKTSGTPRKDLFIQTKYTFSRGQDHRKPYDDKAPIATQVRQSVEKSLEHLGTTYLDSLVLHGPVSGRGISPADWEAWQAMESLATEDKARFLGISNCSDEQVKTIYAGAKVKPRFLQNRCYATTLWDQDNRLFCKKNNITYQGFSLLTANASRISCKEIQDIAQKYSKTIPQIIFRFALDIGMLPLTGTTQSTHMREDLDIFEFQLSQDELQVIENIGR